MSEVIHDSNTPMYGYTPPERLDERQVFELFSRFAQFFHGDEDCFSGIDEDLNLPLQVLILTFDRDCHSVKESMFALYEALYESGYKTFDEYSRHIESIVDDHEEEMDTEILTEFELLYQTSRGVSIPFLVFKLFYAPYMNQIGVLEYDE